ncbi:MAG: DUF805 domain-containing protein [Alphaproteobacteria bacterium]
MNLLFGFNGRIGRGAYWLGVLVVIIVSIAAITAVFSLIDVQGMANTDPQAIDPQAMQQMQLIMYAAMIPGTYISLAVFVKRLHDMGYTGWLSLLSLLPLVNLIMLIWLGVAGGKEGPNEYGPDPRAA